jgi:uncharacterized RmlC-like cupin family protein
MVLGQQAKSRSLEKLVGNMKDKTARCSCVVIHPKGVYHGKQGFDYFAGISKQSAGSTGICMHLLSIPPDGRSTAHYHRRHESIIYVLSGKAAMWYGDGLRKRLTVRAGDFLYIPANTPHLPYNLSRTETCTAVVARTDPNEQESVVLYDVPVRTGRRPQRTKSAPNRI